MDARGQPPPIQLSTMALTEPPALHCTLQLVGGSRRQGRVRENHLDLESALEVEVSRVLGSEVGCFKEMCNVSGAGSWGGLKEILVHSQTWGPLARLPPNARRGT